MPTVQEHLTDIYARIAKLDQHILAIAAVIGDLQRDPLSMEIDLDLPHASAGSAVSGDAAGGQAAVETEASDDSLTVRLPAASPERKEERRRFAEQILRLNEVFPDLDAEGGHDAVGCYAQGGPQWLYLGGTEGRDYILSLPESWRRAMVDDIMATQSDRDAQEFARDVLKDADAGGAREATYDNLLASVE